MIFKSYFETFGQISHNFFVNPAEKVHFGILREKKYEVSRCHCYWVLHHYFESNSQQLWRRQQLTCCWALSIASCQHKDSTRLVKEGLTNYLVMDFRFSWSSYQCSQIWFGWLVKTKKMCQISWSLTLPTFFLLHFYASIFSNFEKRCLKFFFKF